MFKQVLRASKFLSQNSSFSFSEGRMALKREGESKLAMKIKNTLNVNYIKVDDITIGSNSCGQMYNITVESEDFRGKSLVQQHQLVTNSISEELKSIHGYNLKTKVPDNSKNNVNSFAIKGQRAVA